MVPVGERGSSQQLASRLWGYVWEGGMDHVLPGKCQAGLRACKQALAVFVVWAALGAI